MVLNMERTEFDIFVGSRIGSFKHVKYHTEQSKNTKKCIENLQEIGALEKGDGVTCLRWASPEESQVLVGRANRQVQTYCTESGQFTSSFLADYGDGRIVGLSRLRRRVVTALSSGVVRVWGKKSRTDIDAGGELDRMRSCPEDETLVVTGGKENDLKVWRLGEPAPVFSAKNVRHDWLELRAPVWATDVCFLPGGAGCLLAACSCYGHVRLYDTRAQRRPVCEVPFPNMAATCIAPGLDERQVIVGFGRGQMHAVELRGRGRPDKGYKGSVGALTDVALVPGAPYVVSASLDRHLKVHHAVTKELLYKQYLTSKLSCVLVQSARSTPLRRVKDEPPEEGAEVEEEDGEAGADGSDDDLDLIFEDMETVREEEPGNTKRKSNQQKATQKIRKTRDSDEPTQVEGAVVTETEDGIAKLLKLTEKKKRRMEKIKKKKREKSIFHNA